MPLSGWLMASTTPVRIPTTVFGLFELPYPLAPDLAVYLTIHRLHAASAIALATLIAGHASAALVHALWWRDGTLARMTFARCREDAQRSRMRRQPSGAG